MHQELLKNTEETHPDYEALRTSHARLSEVVAEINEKKRQSENIVKIIEIQSNFVCVAGEEVCVRPRPSNSMKFRIDGLLIIYLQPLKVVSPHRKFILEGIFPSVVIGKTKIKPCYFFLFNDIIVVGSLEAKLGLTKKKRYIKQALIPIGNILLWSGNDAEGK